MAQQILVKEFKSLSLEPWTNVELINENIFEWSVALIPLTEESPYHGGYYKARMSFPRNYPYSPPDFRFEKSLYHPNIYPDGRLCISILHQPGEDIMSGESADERWSPAQTVETVLISILSLLDAAEITSPANPDASNDLRDRPEAYRARVALDVARSKEDIPEGFVLPTMKSAYAKPELHKKPSFDFEQSDVESDFGDFGGSDSDEDMEVDDDTGTEEDDEEEEQEEGDDDTEL